MPDYRNVILCTIMAMGLLATAAGRAGALGPTIGDVTIEPEGAARYAKIEITFNLSRSYDNPFDPAQIDVMALVKAPSGRPIEIPAFPYQGFRSALEGDREKLEPAGDLVWKVRFTAVEAGRHIITLRARDGEGVSTSDPIACEVAARDDDGYVRRSREEPRRFAFESGRPYYAIGENVCWPSQTRPLHDYELWFGHLRDARCNFARLWLAGPFIATAPIHSTDDPQEVGPGRYSQRSSWRLDQVIDLAEEDGIYCMLCLDSFNSLRISQPYPAFEQYPLNAKFGGPLNSPDEFFTNPVARDLFQRRLRYYVARWGYSTHVLAWEFWNEVDIIEHYDPPQVAAWHREMARYLRSIDPWQHLITTSFAHSQGDPAVDSLPEMDFVQTHCYGPRDTAGALLNYSRDKAKRYDKPHMVGEFGADALGKGDLEDTQAIHLHNGIWATALSGDAGTAMTWWWDSYVEPRNLYGHFAALARFLRGTDWIHGRYKPATIAQVVFPAGTRVEPVDLAVDPKAESWREGRNPANQPREYRVESDGTVSNGDKLSRVLHGVVNHPDWHNPPTFIVDYPGAGAFEAIVGGVSGWGGANLRIRLDGETKLSADFPDSAAEDHETMHQYDGAYPIDVPAGQHRITVENAGADWAYVSYRFVRYISAPDVLIVGLANPHSAMLWIQNRANTWWNAAQGKRPRPVPPLAVTLADLEDGEYTIEWWDPYTGQRTGRERSQCTRGRLTVQTPEIARDAAFKVMR
jgi:hypothetical protein